MKLKLLLCQCHRSCRRCVIPMVLVCPWIVTLIVLVCPWIVTLIVLACIYRMVQGSLVPHGVGKDCETAIDYGDGILGIVRNTASATVPS